MHDMFDFHVCTLLKVDDMLTYGSESSQENDKKINQITCMIDLT